MIKSPIPVRCDVAGKSSLHFGLNDLANKA